LQIQKSAQFELKLFKRDRFASNYNNKWQQSSKKNTINSINKIGELLILAVKNGLSIFRFQLSLNNFKCFSMCLKIELVFIGILKLNCFCVKTQKYMFHKVFLAVKTHCSFFVLNYFKRLPIKLRFTWQKIDF
jgi:hypothetical protein